MATEIQTFHAGISSFRCADSQSAVLSSRPGLCLTAWLKECIGGGLTSAGLADVEICFFGHKCQIPTGPRTDSDLDQT